jgi:glycosyltransferase involved in cell wall biosynthesis
MQEMEVLAPQDTAERPSSESRAVIILGPPWPRSGSGRGMQNQVDYYRSRGYYVVFISVPVHCSYTESHPDWDELKRGMQEFGADRTFHAYIDQRRFAVAKYTEWMRRCFRGTALDWIIFTAAAARLSDDAYNFVKKLNVSLVHVNHVFTLEFARNLLKHVIRSGAVPMILETHDIQAYALMERGEINDWTHRKDSLDSLLRSEIARLEKTEVLIHVSTDDLEFFKRRLPQKRHVLSMPTINESFVSDLRSVPKASMEIDLLFVGHDTAPNAEAIEWLFEQVWPLISDERYRLKIVGSIAKSVHRSVPALLKKFGSCFAGQVPNLTPFYSAARCVIAPMVSGTGISCKTIEALAIGKPFVGTSKAYRGMPMTALEEMGLRAHDTPEAFANAILDALQMEKEAASASRGAYMRLFSNEVSFAARDEAVRLAIHTGGRIS